ncbi:MAG: MBL fold metallo-hydrolase [Terrimicrobiaceae bacterium]|nr:MBL fold metallo-hydrolase [Terrimicrobiaceae bacterium]
MKEQVPVDPPAVADLPKDFTEDKTQDVTSDVAYKRLAMVNAIFFGHPGAGDRDWVLIDTGVPGLTPLIEKAAKQRFGARSRPRAIILTHGHFDHVGGLKHLAQKWNVSIYAHPLEMPYLDGRASYPPPDPASGGGLMSLLSPLYPKGPIDVGLWLQPLPTDGAVPGMSGWRWIHTPGHSAGHVSLWRETDRVLIAGDAVITTNQESAYAVAVQKPELHGPPMYFTPDWQAARDSVAALALLRPEIIVSGHGRAMRGPEMLRALELLAAEFVQIAVPSKSRYVTEPARAADGSAYREPHA